MFQYSSRYFMATLKALKNDELKLQLLCVVYNFQSYYSVTQMYHTVCNEPMIIRECKTAGMRYII